MNGIGHAALETLDTLALGKPSTLPPRLSIAASNERRGGCFRKTEWQAFCLCSFFRVGSRLTADIFAQPQKPVQLFHGKVQRVDQMAHIHSLQESLAGTAAAPGLLQAAR
ncbi:MAG: hypothetical protein ACLRRT_13190 [Ruthenibacterium lactatiformans]